MRTFVPYGVGNTTKVVETSGLPLAGRSGRNLETLALP